MNGGVGAGGAGGGGGGVGVGVAVGSVGQAVGLQGLVQGQASIGGGVTLEVCWAPGRPGQRGTDHLITWGSDLCLYHLTDIDADAELRDATPKSTSIRLSDKTEAHLVANNSNYHYVKCVDVYPQPSADILLALGQANGKAVLTTFGPTSHDASGINGREFVPRHARPCNAVAWNRIDSNILAVALDKCRNDHSILLWDATRTPPSGDGGLSPRTSGGSLMQYASGLAPVSESMKPVAEMGLSEMTHSLAWLHRQNRTFVVGMNQKQIKLFDLRDFANKAVISAATKAVYGVCVDPHNDYRLASRVDNLITVWDTRVFDRPVLSLPQAKPVTKILWCPTRANLLGSLQRDSSLFYLADLRGLAGENGLPDDGACGDPPSALERSVSPGSSHNITSFSWHPTDSNRLLTIALSGSITDYTVSERITLNWGSGAGPIVWSLGNTLLKMYSGNCPAIVEDISAKIKRRANTDYGHKADLISNGDLAEDERLKKLWNWLHVTKILTDEGSAATQRYNCKHPGIKSVLRMDTSEGLVGSFPVSLKIDFGTIQNTVYKSEDRERCLQLFGWNFDKDFTFLERLESERAYPRAAAIAVFNMKLKAAIDILNRGAEKNSQNAHLSIIAMALSGYSDNAGSIWRQLCSSTKNYLTDPYIRAMFTFLTSENENYEAVLNESGVTVEDKVAFALTYLPDIKLIEYINNLTHRLVEEGNLAGIILTGTNMEGVTVLQNYLDLTGDVQSVSLIAARTFQLEVLKDHRVQEWISSYRNLLDSWHYWSQRASFDITLNSSNPVNKPAHQVYVSCNYCGKSISAYMQGLHNNRVRTTYRLGATTNKLKQISACPNCRKPLPRCAICLLHMGARGNIFDGLLHSSSTNPAHLSIRDQPKTVDFSSWFTWCQSCRHGGHASHMTQWFKDHAECPVTSCICRCFSIDSVSSHSFQQLQIS